MSGVKILDKDGAVLLDMTGDVVRYKMGADLIDRLRNGGGAFAAFASDLRVYTADGRLCIVANPTGTLAYPGPGLEIIE